MKNSEIPMLAIHGALSSLSFAIKQALPEVPVDITIQWRNGTYLTVLIETYGRWVERVKAQLAHGVMPDGFDYRFTCIGHPTGYGPSDYVTISASVATSHVPPEDAKLERWRKIEEAVAA
jgi:hypothetical protein